MEGSGFGKGRGSQGREKERGIYRPMDNVPGKNNDVLCRAVRQSLGVLVLAVLIGLSGNALRHDGLPWIGDWSPPAQLVRSGVPEGMIIALDEAAALFHAGGAVFIDARPEEAFRAGHIAGARNLPWQDFENRFSEAMSDLPPDSILITYCDGESCSLSKDLSLALLGKGYPFARILVNGWTVWKEAGLPAE